MAQVTQSKLVCLEEGAILVESEFPDTFYAIDRRGKGMWIVCGGVEIPVAAEHIEAFATELLEVWQVHKRRTVR